VNSRKLATGGKRLVSWVLKGKREADEGTLVSGRVMPAKGVRGAQAVKGGKGEPWIRFPWGRRRGGNSLKGKALAWGREEGLGGQRGGGVVRFRGKPVSAKEIRGTRAGEEGGRPASA